MGKTIVIGGSDFSAVAVKKVVIGESELFYTNYADAEIVSASPAQVRVGGLHGYVPIDYNLAGKVVSKVSLLVNNSFTSPLNVYKRNINSAEPKELLATFEPTEYTSPGSYDIIIGAVLFGAGDYLEFSHPADSLGATAANSCLQVYLTTGNRHSYNIGTSTEEGVLADIGSINNMRVYYKIYTQK